MVRVEHITKEWKEAGALPAQLNLYGFWDEHAFLTKSGDLGAALKIGGIDYESLDHAGRDYAVKRLEAAVRSLDDKSRLYQILFKRNRPAIPRAEYTNPLVQAAQEQRSAFLASKADRLYSIEIFWIVMVDGSYQKTGLMHALSQLPKQPRSSLSDLRALFSGNKERSLLYEQIERERLGGAWARIKYVIEQLIHYRADLTLANFNLDAQRLIDLGNRPPQSNEQLLEWFQYLETLNVFFSSPLDLDFLLLETFTAQYMAATTGTGPIIPTAPAARNKRLESASSAVMKPEGGNGQTYTPAQRELFIWYQYLFLGRGKPVTHMLALNAMDDATFAAGVPPVLSRLVERCMQLSGIALPARPAA